MILLPRTRAAFSFAKALVKPFTPMGCTLGNYGFRHARLRR